MVSPLPRLFPPLPFVFPCVQRRLARNRGNDCPRGWPSARNELPAKITATGAIEEGIARVINEPDVLLVAGWRRRVGELAAGADGLARGTLARTIVPGQRGGGCW